MHFLFALLTLVGTWQGTINGPNGPARRIMEITKASGGYHVAIHSIDETDTAIVTDNVTINGNTVTMKFDMNSDPWFDYHRTYVATLTATTLKGAWGGPGLPNTIDTNYTRVTKATWQVIAPKATMVEVQPGVKIEALDWGGSGRPVVWLAGLGNTGHDFYKIVPALKSKYHLYSITRRGFGNSDKPEPTKENYSVVRLSDDVLTVIAKLNIKKPVLLGHSIAGEELSYIGMHDSDKIAGLVYLDAGWFYAYDGGVPDPDANATPPPGAPPMPIGEAVIKGVESLKGPINAPILAIYAHPHEKAMYEGMTDAQIAAREATDTAQINAFENGLHATVVRIPNASHFVFLSNTDEVLRDINAFIAKLPN